MAEKVSYFLSCYQDLQMSNYDNTSLEAFQLSESDVLWFEDCNSTNDVLMDFAKHKTELPPMVCVAENQHSGRGQHGRSWLSDEGNLHLSMLLPTRNMFEIDGKLALEVAMSMIDVPALHSLKMNNLFRLGIKWPNDLCILKEHGSQGRPELQKFGGILIEPVKDSMGSLNAIIVGIGLNVNNTELTKAEGKPIANLSELTGTSIDLTLLAAQICYACQHAINRFARGSAGIFARYYLHDLLYEQAVEIVKSDGSSLQGVAAGVDADGSLKLVRNEQTENVYDGQVHLL